MGTGPASSQAQANGPSEPAADGLFSFTPIKALRAIPHLWERKPSTPFQTGAKSRKLWKRVRSSLTSMKSLETSTMLEHDAFQTAINASRDASYARGVKRLCVGAGEPEKRPNFQMQEPSRSFFETKWESEASQKRRKLPDAPINIFDETLQNNDSDLAMTGSPRPLNSLCSPSKTTVFNDNKHRIPDGASDTIEEDPVSGPVAREQGAMTTSAANDRDMNMAPTPTKVVRDLTQQKKGTLVRSALRSSLDGSDAELLNDFLSKAQAKRAAKAALMDQEGDVTKETSSAEDSPDAETTTPRSRRALDVLDTNSPSPVKLDVAANKDDIPLVDEAHENEVPKVILEDSAPASPSFRRSTRAKVHTARPPHVRNTISLRRAKGNEFIFLQRTEAQELALTTKKNTRQNMGNAVPPQVVLEAMAKEQSDGTSPVENDRKARHRSSTRKSVTWNEEQLVEYEVDRQDSEAPEEKGNSSGDDVTESIRSRSAATKPENKASSQRSSRSQMQESSSEEPESAPTTTTAPTTAPPRSRRVRRLGDSSMVSGTPVKTGSGRLSKPPAPMAPTVAAAGPSTPTKARRKLTPKSPSSSMLTAPVSKIAGAPDQSFVSAIPTRSTSASEGNSELKRGVFQSNAGCTPRRVRVRN
ncbi:hypothetical protein N7490_007813 [Penicillium lividum]|nr:hypothetical protein N7490_007813 [Penicillium lividum]